eukprot:4670935-Amphidinium_carterae.1
MSAMTAKSSPSKAVPSKPQSEGTSPLRTKVSDPAAEIWTTAQLAARNSFLEGSIALPSVKKKPLLGAPKRVSWSMDSTGRRQETKLRGTRSAASCSRPTA